MISVLSGGAVQTFMQPLAASFRGDTVKLEFQPMGKLVKALSDGYRADVLVVTREVLEQLSKQNKVSFERAKAVAAVGVGVAVHESAPLPDLATAEAFKKALLAAKSVIYMDPQIGTSGKHVAEVLSRLGIENELRSKTTLGQGGQIAEAVGRGEIELAIHQISEILPVKGARLAGPLPPGLQKYTVYSAVARTSAPAVAEFIKHLTGPQARSRLAQAGYTSPA